MEQRPSGARSGQEPSGAEGGLFLPLEREAWRARRASPRVRKGVRPVRRKRQHWERLVHWRSMGRWARRA